MNQQNKKLVFMLNSAELGLLRREMTGRTIPVECQRLEASIRAYVDNKVGLLLVQRWGLASIPWKKYVSSTTCTIGRQEEHLQQPS